MKRVELILILLMFIGLVEGQNTVFIVSTSDASAQPSMAICELNEELGEISLAKPVEGGDCPNYMTLTKDRRFMYAVSTENFSNQNSHNSIRSFGIPEGVLDMEESNTQSSSGEYPCYISLSPEEEFLFVANYITGSIASYELTDDGSIGAALSNWEYTGAGDPKAHYVHTSNDGRFVYAVLLGLDRVMNFSLSEEGIMSPNPEQDYLSVEPNAGPRHMAFHKNGKNAFILNELGNTVISCSIDSASGVLSIIDTWSTLPEGHSGISYAGAIRIHPNGEYLYCSNRGHNSIVSFRIEANGNLTKTETVTEGIGWVRDFNIVPSGKYLVAGYEKTNSIALCLLDESGGIEVSSSSLDFIKPACFVIYGKSELSTYVQEDWIETSIWGLGISIINQGQRISLYYELQTENEMTIEVFNQLGQKAYSMKKESAYFHHEILDLSAEKLPAGVYFCRVSSEAQSATKTFILP